MSTPPTYLSGLDSLRWYSAFAVIITHVELHKRYHGLPNVWESVWIQNLGPVGVYFFFTLSGFLITWLLQRERGTALSIVLLQFYRRRSYRILPLYYLLVVIGFFVLPQLSAHSDSGDTSATLQRPEFVAFAAAQPHVASAFLERVPGISHLWSIGVELTFYCFWPMLVLTSRNLKRSIMVFITGIITVKALLFLFGQKLLHNPAPVFHFAATLKFECMAVGALFALSHGKRLQTLLLDPRTTWCAGLAIPAVFLLYGTPADNIVHLPLSVLFGVLICSTAFCSKSPVRYLNNRISKYLGQISYGIYCYHVLCISLLLNVLPMQHIGVVWGNVLLYSGTLLLTTAVSAASFRFFESPISRRARRPTPVALQPRQSNSHSSHKSAA